MTSSSHGSSETASSAHPERASADDGRRYEGVRGAVEQPRDGEACGHWLGKLTEHLVSERLLVARGATSRLEGRYRLPLPAALADLAARVNDYLELLVRDELTRGLGVVHAAEHAGAQYPPAEHGHAQRDGDGARRFNSERRSAHHGGVELHGDDDHAALRNGEIGVGGTGLQSMRQTV